MQIWISSQIVQWQNLASYLVACDILSTLVFFISIIAFLRNAVKRTYSRLQM